MSKPFTQIVLQPNYGGGKVVVCWECARELAGADVYVYRSPTGTKGTFELLNDGAPAPEALGFWIDEGFRVRSKRDTAFYGLSAELGGKVWNSPVVELMEQLPPREYGFVHRVMQEEFLMMRSGSGVRVWHCVWDPSAGPSPGTDPDSGELLECADGSYGTGRDGGWLAPLCTWMSIPNIGAYVTDIAAGGTGMKDEVAMQARLLAFPRPRTGHMVVHPPTDSRYLIGPAIQVYSHRGVVPVAWSCKLEMLPRNHPAYGFPVPGIDGTAAFFEEAGA